MRDLTCKDLLQLATIDPMNGKGIAAYQKMREFQAGMETIQRMAGKTQEELSKVSESILALSKGQEELTDGVQSTGQPIYTDISAPFQWGERQVCHAVEWVSTDRMRRCILDAETHQEITTLDLGAHVVHAGGAYTIHEVVESEKPATITWTGDVPPDTTITIEHN